MYTRLFFGFLWRLPALRRRRPPVTAGAADGRLSRKQNGGSNGTV
jgi:hypothetical protein